MARRSRRLLAASCLLCLALAVCLAPLARAQEMEIDDDEEPEEQAPPAAPAQRPPVLQLRPQDSWLLEICCLAFLAAFLANIFIGRRRNEQLALEWTGQLMAHDGVLERNFSLLGPGDASEGAVLLKDSAYCYKVWASGRRFCQGMLATFNLVRRQDLLAYAVQAVRGQKDVLELEVRMNDGAMPPLVLVIAPPATAREIQQQSDDVKALCKPINPTRDRIAQWPERLTVLGEHPSAFYDLMTPQLLELAFGREAYQEVKPYFRFLHISSDAPDGPHKQVVRLSFNLPPQGDVSTLNRFLVLALLVADLLGSYRPSPEQLKRAAEARQKKEAEEAQREGGKGDERQKRAEERRLAKLDAEKERLRKLPPDQRAKEVEKKQKLQMKRAMSKFSKKM